jgi:hypothetical protein
MVDADMPLKLTMLVPCVDPKPLPAMVTDAAIAPEVGDRLEIVGPTANKLAGRRIEIRTNAERLNSFSPIRPILPPLRENGL